MGQHRQQSNFVLSEQIRHLYSGYWLSAFAVLINAAILVFLLWPAIDHSILISWLVVVYLVYLGRGILVRRFRSLRPEGESINRWGNYFLFGTFLGGLCWGSASFLMFPHDDPVYQAFLIVMIAGMSAGSVSVLSARWIAVMLFLIPTLVPLIIHLLIHGGARPFAIGTAIGLFLVIMLTTAKRNYESILNNIVGHYEETTRESEAARQESELSNQSKSEFLSRINHEIRTPLNAILGFSQLLQRDKESLNEEQVDNLEEIVKAGHHLGELVNDMLDLAKIEAGAIQLDIEPVEVGGLVEDCRKLVQPRLDERKITFLASTINHARPLADPMRLKQILLNLLTNAVKYNRDGGSIRVDGGITSEGTYRISVKDTGPGLSPDQQDQLFQPFNRLAWDKTNTEGTGIGLVICRQLVTLMNGKMGVDSQLGAGCTFWLDFPQSTLHPAVHPSTPSSAHSA